VFKALGLSVGYNLLAKLAGWPVSENKKPVMKKNNWKATLRCIVHLVPILAALALLILNGLNLYIGGELSGTVGQDSQKLGALLFAAKLHELFMLASLGAILMTHIRKELAFGDGVPFGTVFSATQFKDLTFIWSPELWGSIRQRWQSKRTKWYMICMLVICSLLGLTVGPSTGNLMRPRLDEWPAGGTPFWINATETMLNPKTMEPSPELAHCAFDNSDLACPAAGWRVFDEQYFPRWKSLEQMDAVPEALPISGRSSLRQFILRSRNTRDVKTRLLWSNPFTLASVAPAVVADTLFDLEKLWIYAAANSEIGNYRYRRDASFTTDTSQPLVLARCEETIYTTNNTIKLGFPNFHNHTLTKGPSSYAIFGEPSLFNDQNTTLEIGKQLDARSPPALHWIDDASLLEATNSSIAVVATLPSLDGTAFYYTCSIDSRMANVTLKTLRSMIMHVSGSPANYEVTGTFNDTFRPISLTAEWARYLNPTILEPGRNSTVFSTLASTAGLWNSKPRPNREWFPIIIENILATLVANGISRANFNSTTVGTLIEPGFDAWASQILPKKGGLGGGGNIFVVSEEEKATATEFKFEAQVLGYAYSPRGKTQVAAMTVLSAYVLLVLCHIGYSVITGWYSSGWGTTSELTALAMNSDPTDKLKNTGAGIETIQVFSEKVTIRLKDERLQMVFKDGDPGQKIQAGKAYA
jgi:hypothetical protein